MLLFFNLAPLLNALSDWLSLAATRWFLARYQQKPSTGTWVVYLVLDVSLALLLTGLLYTALMAVLEAMAAGISAIASNAGGNPYILRHGENGFLFPSGESAVLAVQLEQLGTDQGLRNRLALSARQEVEQRYSLRAAADRLGEIYDGFLAR